MALYSLARYHGRVVDLDSSSSGAVPIAVRSQYTPVFNDHLPPSLPVSQDGPEWAQAMRALGLLEGEERTR